jgi:hypothetical protein
MRVHYLFALVDDKAYGSPTRVSMVRLRILCFGSLPKIISFHFFDTLIFRERSEEFQVSTWSSPDDF